MAFGWGALIGAGIGAISSAFGAKQQNKAAQAAAERQMAFQRESAQNRYQWTMADMKKAGLNPILAYKQGGGGTLGGSSYTPQNVGEAAVRGASAGGSTAMAARRLNQELDLMGQEEWTKREQGDLFRSQVRKADNEIKLLKQDYEIRKADVASAKATKQFYEGEGGNLMRKIELIMKSIGVKSPIPTRRR